MSRRIPKSIYGFCAYYGYSLGTAFPTMDRRMKVEYTNWLEENYETTISRK